MATPENPSTTAAAVVETRISCFSKRSQDVANERVFTAIDEVIEKNVEWSEEQTDRLRRRFREVYKNALHENSTIDGQSWAEAADDLDTTKEFEPVDLKMKVDAEEMAAELDSLIVETMEKRKTCPPRLIQHEGKKLRCLHTALEQYKPILEKSIADHSPILSVEDEAAIAGKVSTTSMQVAALSRILPDLVDKSSRLQEAVTIHSALANNDTYQVITKPLQGESEMATSLTPLRARMEATATSITRPPAQGALKRRATNAKQTRGDHIKHYRTSSTTTTTTTTPHNDAKTS